MLRNHVEKSCWARNGFSNAPTSGARRGGDGCSVSNAHFFGRRAEKFLWGTRDTKVSIWWRRGGSSDNQGGENSSSKKATTSKGTLYLSGRKVCLLVAWEGSSSLRRTGWPSKARWRCLKEKDRIRLTFWSCCWKILLWYVLKPLFGPAVANLYT